MDEMIAGTDIGFQSTPVIANGRILIVAPPASWSQKFQSTPVIANGRISTLRISRAANYRFNPRPLLLTGESGRNGPPGPD